MTFKSMRLICVYVTLLALTGLFAACGGGGGDVVKPPYGQDFSLIVAASPDSGIAPLTVTFFATPSGGSAPYTFAWDFDGDGVTDSNSASGTFIYTADGIASVVVTDAAAKTVTGSRSITITSGTLPASDELTVKFNASPQMGNVPFECQFTAIVTGGKKPYSYSWDFNGDGTPDSFLQNPLHVFEQVGQQVDTAAYVFYPVLTVTDNRGVKATNLDDRDGNTQPDFRVPINAMPPSELNLTAIANPLTGQSPLTVELTGAATGGSGDYEYKWNFGDGQGSSYNASSITSHTFVADGIYLATCTVHDMTTNQLKSSAPLRIVASPEQQFSIEISGDIASGQVPFLVNFEVIARNGQEPIVYEWDVFDDEPLDPAPSLTMPPALDPNAVVTPNFTYRKNPVIHFANTARQNGQKQFVVRCVARDNQGNTTVSNLMRVTANGTYPPNGNPFYYEAERPDVVGASTWDPSGNTAHPLFQATNARWTPRANAAVCSHPTGITFIIGGEILDENGNLDKLVDRGDSMYMYMPRTLATGSNQGDIGKFHIGGNLIGATAIPGLAGGLVRLNDDYGPVYPGQGADCPVFGGGQSQRSSQFTIVGSAAAVFAHEIPETNPKDGYEGVRNDPERDIQAYYPDDPLNNWNRDGGGDNPRGLGCPIIYVFGGRDGNGQPVDLIQKYYVYGFGSESLECESEKASLQITGNQTNIWSNYFYRPDRDHNADPLVLPVITDRSGTELPTLPEPLYGLTAVVVETGVQAAAPDFPNGPFRNVYLFGGINANGQVMRSCYTWSLNSGPSAGGNDSPVQPMTDMPSPRAYGKALFLPYTFQIALVGGHDQNGVAMNTIDILNLDNPFNPVGGAWSTFEGTLPEALVACGAGYLDNGETSESWVLTLGGWNQYNFSSSLYQARLRSDGNVVLKAPIAVVPRRNAGSTQSGSRILAGAVPGLTFNRFYVVAGVDENGSDSIIEVVSLP
jgi:PKD repeat protein